MRKILIAVGGNAISPPDKKESVAKRLVRLEKAILRLKPLFKKYRVLLTHGNGFDVGALSNISPLPLDSLGAMTQGQLGYWLQQTLSTVLKKECAVVITRVLVDPKDPAFRNPTKPVGPWRKGKRRRVPSPKPIKIVEEKIIQKLFSAGFIVIACGGGGIPVVRKQNRLKGIEAVIDKDLSAVKLAQLVRADTLLILTNVKAVYLNFGKKNQKRVVRLPIKTAESLLKKGAFGVGSMGPKIKAAIAFLKGGGKNCFIGSLENPSDILKGKTGTRITL